MRDRGLIGLVLLGELIRLVLLGDLVTLIY
jgi:hypothetical protein